MSKRRKKDSDLKRRLKDLIDDESLESLPDGAYWGVVNERLGLQFGDAQEIIAGDPEYFGYTEST